MSKRGLMMVGMWLLTLGLALPVFIGCGGGGTKSDILTGGSSTSAGTSGGTTTTTTTTTTTAAAPPTFTFASPAISPSSGGAGIVVTLTSTGADLSSATHVVFPTAGSTPVFSHPTKDSITVKVPQGARNGLLSITGGVNTAPGTSPTFTTEPTVTGFTPNIAVAGTTQLTILGTNFCAATKVTVNSTAVTFAQTAECNGSDIGLPGNPGNITITGITVPSTITAPITNITVTTTNGSGSNAASAYTGKGSETTNTRVAVLRSYASGVVQNPWEPVPTTTLTFTVGDIAAGGGLLYFADAANNRLISVNPASGAFLTSHAAPAGATYGQMKIGLFPTLNSVVVAVAPTSFPTKAAGNGRLTSVLMVMGEPTGSAAGSIAPVLVSFQIGLLASDGLTAYQGNGDALGSSMAQQQAVGTQFLVSHIAWLADTGGNTLRLLSFYVGGNSATGFGAATALGSIAIAGELAKVAGRGEEGSPFGVVQVAVNNDPTVGGDRVWFITRPSLFSVGVLATPGQGNPIARLSSFVLPAPASTEVAGRITFSSLGSLWIPMGRQIVVLSSAGTQSGLFSLAIVGGQGGSFLASAWGLASFGAGFPLVSVAAADSSGNVWYADSGQQLLVRCATSCNTTLTSFTLRNTSWAFGLAADRPRAMAVDGLGSVWLDTGNALFRLMP